MCVLRNIVKTSRQGYKQIEVILLICHPLPLLKSFKKLALHLSYTSRMSSAFGLPLQPGLGYPESGLPPWGRHPWKTQVISLCTGDSGRIMASFVKKHTKFVYTSGTPSEPPGAPGCHHKHGKHNANCMLLFLGRHL